MPEITETLFVNAAQAVNKGVSGSDAMKATTLCILEMDDGSVVVGWATTYDTSDDGERKGAALARATAAIPQAVYAPTAEAPTTEAVGVDERGQPVTETGLPATEAELAAGFAVTGAETTAAPEANDTLTTGAGDDTVTATAGDDTLSPSTANDTVTAPSGADALMASAEALANPAAK